MSVVKFRVNIKALKAKKPDVNIINGKQYCNKSFDSLEMINMEVIIWV